MQAVAGIRASLASLLAAAALAGCGGGGAGAAPSTAGTDGKTSAPGPPAGAFRPRLHHDSGGGSAQFAVKGGDNSVQEFGSEASPGAFRRAAAALHGFLDARAERDWAAACAYLNVDARKSLQPAGSCAIGLAAIFGDVPAADLRQAAIADVGSLRRSDNRGAVIYRGAGGAVYASVVTREDGRWMVASLTGVPLG